MKRIIVFFLMMISIGSIAQYTTQNLKLKQTAVAADSGLHIPIYPSTPYVRTGILTRAGNLGIDSVLNLMYYYSSGSFRRLAQYTDVTSLTRTLDQVTTAGNSTPNSVLIGASGTPSSILEIQKANIDSTVNDTWGLTLKNPTLGTSGMRTEWTPVLKFSGNAYKSTGGVNNTLDFIIQNRPITGPSVTGNLSIDASVNGATYRRIFKLSQTGVIVDSIYGGGGVIGTAAYSLSVDANGKFINSTLAPTSVTKIGFENPSIGSGVLNIPRNERTGLYISLHKTPPRAKTILIGSVLQGLGNSWASGAFSTGTPYITQIGAYFGKTVSVSSAASGDDINGLVYNSHAFGTFGNDTTTIVDLSVAPAFGFITAGQPGSFFYYNDHPNNPQVEKTKNYIYGTYKAFIANYYLDNDWFSVASLADPNFRDGVTSDSLLPKSSVGSIGLGAFSFTKPAGKTSLVIGTYGADSTKCRQGTITVSLAGNTIFSKYFNGLNDANKGNSLYIKSGLNYEAIVLQNLPDSAATVVVTCSGDSTRFDYVGYLKPKEKAVRPLYINNMGYGAGYLFWTIPVNLVDTANLMLQNAVNEFRDYPVFIQNTNNWFDSTRDINASTHPNSSGNDSVTKAYTGNLISQSYTPVNPNYATGIRSSDTSSYKPVGRNMNGDLVMMNSWPGGGGGGGWALTGTSTLTGDVYIDQGGHNLEIGSSTFNTIIGDVAGGGDGSVFRFNNGVASFNNAAHDLTFGINTTFPSAVLHVVGSLKFVTGNEGSGKVLTSDGSGNADWATPVVTASSTNTFTNKRWVPRVGSTTSSATPTINTDNVDIYKLTAQAADITSFTTNLSGTPNDGDVLEIQITGTAARALTFGASFVASTVALPTTTVTTATLTVIFQYYTTSSYGNNKWVCVNYY